MIAYPVGLDVAGRPCLVVGGGPVAARKAAGLLQCGAAVTLVAPDVVESIRTLDGLRIEQRPYRPGEAARYRLVIAATGDDSVDSRVALDADAAGVWVNVADDPVRCSVILPAVLRRGPISVAVSTSGVAPALASWLRDRIAEVVGPEFEQVARQLGDRRAAIHAEGRSTEGLDWYAQIDELVATK